jgi:restriction system protein
MDPYEFEELVAELWELQGYETTVRKGSGDRGIDVEAIKKTPFEQKLLIQAKRYTEGNKIGSEEVRNYATLYQQVSDADTVVIVTTSEYTTEAERLARDLNVKIIDSNSLIDMISDNYTNIGNFATNKPSQRNNENSGEFNSGYNNNDLEKTKNNHSFDVTSSMMKPTKDHDYQSTCSNCSSNEIWYTEKPNQKASGRNMQRLLKCYSCGRLWGEEPEQKGIIRTSYEWKVYKKGE